MASYSMELWEMVDNPLTPLFAFKYDFYCDDLEVKKKFEEKFINHYWLHEIGCETPARWNQMLKSRLNLIMPYYRQLYATELASQNIDFLLNKDLTESTTRELSGIENDTGNKRLTNEESQNLTSTSTSNGEFSSSNLILFIASGFDIFPFPIKLFLLPVNDCIVSVLLTNAKFCSISDSYIFCATSILPSRFSEIFPVVFYLILLLLLI